MREFKFDIDKWTGGNTIGSGMGDIIGSTVDIPLFSIKSYNKYGKFMFTKNNEIPLVVDWGDGETETFTTKGDYTHSYKGNDSNYLNITFSSSANLAKETKGIEDVSFISLHDNIADFTILENALDTIYNYIDFNKNDYMIKDLIIDKCTNKTTIGKYALSFITIESDIVLPYHIKYIDEECFSNSIFLGKFTIPHELIQIGENPFYKLYVLDDLILPQTKTIKAGMYESLGVNQHLVIPDTVEVIEDGAFESLGFDVRIQFSKNLKYIGKRAFRYGDLDASVLIFNEGLVEIDDEAFCKMWIRGDLRFPPSVKRIGQQAFRKCKSLDNVVFNEGLVEIDNEAFIECPNIGNIILPESVKRVGEKVFTESENPINKRVIYICEDTDFDINNMIDYKNGSTQIIVYKRGQKPKIN